jgi:hypothetical protein
MDGNETDSLNYAIRLTFGIVHSVILTLITFGLVSWYPSFSHWSFTLLGCIVLPLISFVLTCFATGCVLYVRNGEVSVSAAMQNSWIPPLGIFSVSLFILPLKMMQSTGIGPLNMLIATSIFVNAILVCVLQVYAVQPRLEPKPIPQSSSVSDLSSNSLPI